MMSIHKTFEFDEHKVRFAQLNKALSHPARLAILEILASREQCMCGNIATMLPLAQSTVSQHLKLLKEAELIKGTITGSSICYDINPDTMRECCEMFGDFCENILSYEKVQNGNEMRACAK